MQIAANGANKSKKNVCEYETVVNTNEMKQHGKTITMSRVVQMLANTANVFFSSFPLATRLSKHLF